MLFTCIVIFFIKDTLFSLKFQMSKFIFLYIFCFQLILCKNPNPRGLTIFQVCFFWVHDLRLAIESCLS